MNANDFLSAIEPYRSLTGEHRSSICNTLRRHEFQAGDLLMPESSWIDNVGFLVAGRADVYLGWRTPAQKKVYSVYPGDFFGDLTCLTARKSFVTMVCREISVVYLQAYEDFMHTLEAHDRLKIHFLQSAVDKLWRFFQMAVNGNADGETTEPPGAHLPVPIQKTLAYLNRHYEKPLTVSRVSKMAGMSQSAFSRRFKQCMGTSFKHYLNRLRVSKAKWLISQKGMNVTEACFSVGFNDVAYFSRTFRKIEGRSPSHHKNSPKFAPPNPPQLSRKSQILSR